MAVEFMLVMGTFVAVFLILLAYAVKSYSHRAAEAAAEDGLASAARYDGSISAGRSAAQRSLASTGRTLTHTDVSVSRGDETATVTVRGTAPEFLPFIPMTVTVTLTAPVERFIPEQATRDTP